MTAARSAVDMLATMLFPRSGSQPWGLRFDSPSLERDFCRAAFTHERESLLHALVTLTLAFSGWFAYVIVAEFSNLLTPAIVNSKTSTMLPYVFGITLAHFVVILAAFVILFYNCRKPVKTRLLLGICSLAAILSAATGFITPSALFAIDKNVTRIISPTGVMAIHALTVFLAYTLTTLPIIVALVISTFLTISVEILLFTTWKLSTPREHVIARLLIYLAIHLISFFVRLAYESRLRTGFWYGAQSLIASRRLDIERRLRQKLVLSIMPQAFAEFVFSPIKPKKSVTSRRPRPPEDEQGEKLQPIKLSKATVRHNELSEHILGAYEPKPPTVYWLQESGKSDFELLHDFHVEKFENVSIIHANICGFTTISSKKLPAEWVPLLNEIFDRFDAVCRASGCERISILGDRYICLSGCPTPRDDHAQSCIEAGLGMCKVIETFNANHHEDLSIHVGIHTGSIQAGLFGTQRYKFDVWGDDCNFCDDVMESSDQPGRVLISGDTHTYVKDDYVFEPHREIYDFRKSNEMEEHFDPVAKRMVWSNKKTTWTYFLSGRHKKCRFQTEGEAESQPQILGEEAASTPLLNKPTQDLEKNKREDLTLAPASFTLLPAHPVALCFKNCQVESEYNNRFSYEPVPAEDRAKFSIKSSESLTEFYAADGLHFAGPTYPDDPIDIPLLNSDKPVADHRCQLLAPVFPDWTAYGDNIASLITVSFITIVCIIIYPVSACFIAISSASFATIGLFLLVAPALPSLIDEKRNSATICKGGFRSVQILAGGLFAAFPGLFALATFSCQIYVSKMPQYFDLIYLTIIIAALIHLALFAQVPYYVRATLAILISTGVVLLLALSQCKISTPLPLPPANFNLNKTSKNLLKNNAVEKSANFENNTCCALVEVILSLCGIVIAVCVVARRSELAARLTVYAALESRLTECAVQKAQKRNDGLLAYVVPLHVLARFSEQQIYYQHHPNCGVIVVRIANFGDYYEESFSGRDGSLHVLNKIFSEFEALLEKRRFKDVEKVKTSVPSLLCAAGLDAHRRTMQRENTAHLYALMAYCFELIDTMRKFNQPRQFKFKMRIGFDTGDLVSGILGSMLLHYDVWGDTVNFANKMCLGDCGQDDGVIQVSEAAVELLKDKFNFEEFETIAMSGKGDVKTYLAVSEKPITYQHLVPPPGNSSGVIED